MAWKMDSHGNWTQTGGTGNSSGNNNSGSNENKVVSDKGNTSDTNTAIADTTTNKTNEIKYAEEANFSCEGDYAIRRGGKFKVGKGVASRWKGKWKILETTHTIDTRGYKTEGRLGRIPYVEESSSGDSSSSSGSSDSGSSSGSGNSGGGSSSGSPGKSDSSGGEWYMDSSGVWRKRGK